MKREKAKKKSKENIPGKKPSKKVLDRIGGFLHRVFGKARWFLIAEVVLILLMSLFSKLDPNGKKSYNVTTSYVGETIKLSEILAASVSHDGLEEMVIENGYTKMTVLVNVRTGEPMFYKYPYITENGNEYSSGRFILGNDGKTYAIVIDYSDENSTKIAKERIVSIRDDMEIERVYCTIEYDGQEGLQMPKLSRLICSDGKINFACVGRDETRLYSIDTETQALSISDPYPADPDGTFTFAVLPLSDSFLFMRSDGNVYRTRFGEPLGESIFHFEEQPNKYGSFFKFAAVANGKLYVYRYSGKGELYCLENGTLTEVTNVLAPEDNGDPLKVLSIDSCRLDGSGNESLVITLKDRIATFDGSTVTDKDVTLHLVNGIWWYASVVLSLLFWFNIAALMINVIIRKKTLLYKQIAVTLPVLMVPAMAVAFNLYFETEKDNTDNTEKELDLVCSMGVAALDGYDFTGLDTISADTGRASRRLQDKLGSFDHDKTKYIFSVIKRMDDSSAAVLASTDQITVPLYYTDDIVSSKEITEYTDGSGNYRFRKIQGFMSKDAKVSEIYVLGRLDTPEGEYYLKVKTNTWNFWTMRRDLVFKLLTYIFSIIAALTAITVLSSIYITRTIKKATKAVEQISGGDLSARVSYRSKDELGEICSQVNGMAQSLETLFAEKDKTERFYYKFVPEKFRELLGKDSFTDLALGDASSRELTVLFFDIRAFSINSEIMTAKENFEFVNVIYGKAGPIVRSHGGFIDKYIGDAVMALFESADDAVKCGIELYRAIVLDRSTAEAIHVSDLNIGIGIHSGMARIGIVGESERLSGTVISDTVNLSSRLETLTKQYKTAMLISKDTVDRMTDPDSLGLRYLGIVQVAGVNEVKAVYEVLDCLPDKEKRRRSVNALDMREAIRLFHLGRRAEAVKILKKLSAAGKSDYVTDMYLEYISGMSEKDKGNVFRFVKK